MTDEPILYSIPEVMQLAKVSRSLLYLEIAAGRLKILKLGRRTMISQWSLRSWLEALERESAVNSSASSAATEASVKSRSVPRSESEA